MIRTIVFLPWNTNPCDPGARPDRWASLCRLRSLQRLAAYASRWRKWHDLLALHGRTDRRYSRAAGEVPTNVLHRLPDRGAYLSGAVYVRRHVPR